MAEQGAEASQRRSVEGLFVALEGIEGCGKSTQARILADRLRAEGRDVVMVREPGGTEFAEQMRHLVLHHPYQLTAAAELFLYQAARSDLTTRVIRPALEQGSIVIADRYELSTRAYQGAGRGLPEALVQATSELATGGVQPDIYIVLDFSVADMRRRSEGKQLDKLERADDAFFQRVADAFRSAQGANVAHLEAVGPVEDVALRVWTAVAPRLASGKLSGSSRHA